MSDNPEGPENQDFPLNWDVLHDQDAAPEPAQAGPAPAVDGPLPPSTLTLLAASWGDVVAALAVCTAALVALAANGLDVGLGALPWAAALGSAWWLAATATLVMVRQGTPGMLLAGVVFTDRVVPSRLPAVLGAAVAHGLLLGLPGILGARRSPLALAAGSTITPTGA